MPRKIKHVTESIYKSLLKKVNSITPIEKHFEENPEDIEIFKQKIKEEFNDVNTPEEWYEWTPCLDYDYEDEVEVEEEVVETIEESSEKEIVESEESHAEWYDKYFENRFSFNFGERNRCRGWMEENTLSTCYEGKRYYVNVRFNYSNFSHTRIFDGKIRIPITLPQWLFLNQRSNLGFVDADEFFDKMTPWLRKECEIRTQIIPDVELDINSDTDKYVRLKEGEDLHPNFEFDDMEGEYGLISTYSYKDRIVLLVRGNDNTAYIKHFKSEEELKKEFSYLKYVSENGGICRDLDFSEVRGYHID